MTAGLLAAPVGHTQLMPAPTIEWQRVYGGTENDLLQGLRQTADGGYILGGASYSPTNGNKTATNSGFPDFWIVRLDSEGNHRWDRSFGGRGYNSLTTVSETGEGGFIIGGSSQCGIGGTKTTPHFGGPFDYWVIRVDAQGNQVWEQDLGGTSDDSLKAIVQTSDGAFVLAGFSGSLPSGNKTTMPFGGPGQSGNSGYPDYWVVRLDANGNKLSEAIYGGIYGEYLWAAERTRDGGLVLGGASSSPPSGNKTSPNYGTTNYLLWTPDFWIVRLDTNGTLLWDRSYGGTNDDTLYAIAELPDGGFALGGRSDSPPGGNKTSPNYGNWDYWLIRTDASGNKVWEQTFGGADEEFLYSLDVTTDGGLILGGYSHSEVSGNKTAPRRGRADYWVIRLDADGHKVWEETYGGSRNDGMDRKSLQQTRDGGFILGGYSTSPADGNKTVPPWFGMWCDFWLVKLAPEQPRLRLTPSPSAPGGWQLMLDGIKNLTYAVDYAADLKSWKLLGTNRLTSSTAEIPDPRMTNASQRFYRARRLP